MLEEAQLTALLHVSTVLTVLCLAFVGIDTSHRERPNYKDGMLSAKPKAKAVLLRLGINGPAPIDFLKTGWWFRVQTTLSAAILCVIAQDPIQLNKVLYPVHCCKSFPYVPLWGYFKKGTHVRNVGILAALSVVVFCVSAASIIWSADWLYNDHFEGIDRDWFVKLLFVLELFGLAWLVGTGVCMSMLNQERLEDKCDRLEAKISAHFDAAKKKQRDKLRKNKLRLSQNVEFYTKQAEFNRQAAERTRKRLEMMGDDPESPPPAPLVPATTSPTSPAPPSPPPQGTQTFAPDASAYAKGERIFHQKFGYGRITFVEGNRLTVDFDKVGQKRVIDQFVSRA